MLYLSFKRFLCVAPSGPPKDFRVEAIGNSEPAILSVHWARPNDVDINGKLRGYKVKYREMAPVDLRRRDDGYQEMSVSSSNLVRVHTQ